MNKKVEEKNLQFAQSLIRETDFSDKKIAELTGVKEGYIQSAKLTVMPASDRSY